jgi:hypothetical protein
MYSDVEREFNEKQSNVQLLEKEVAEGRKCCIELEEEHHQVNKEIGEARVSLLMRCETKHLCSPTQVWFSFS